MSVFLILIYNYNRLWPELDCIIKGGNQENILFLGGRSIKLNHRYEYYNKIIKIFNKNTPNYENSLLNKLLCPEHREIM